MHTQPAPLRHSDGCGPSMDPITLLPNMFRSSSWTISIVHEYLFGPVADPALLLQRAGPAATSLGVLGGRCIALLSHAEKRVTELGNFGATVVLTHHQMPPY
jgi:hypothetical protein